MKPITSHGPGSDGPDAPLDEPPWRCEAKAFYRELNQYLDRCLPELDYLAACIGYRFTDTNFERATIDLEVLVKPVWPVMDEVPTEDTIGAMAGREAARMMFDFARSEVGRLVESDPKQAFLLLVDFADDLAKQIWRQAREVVPVVPEEVFKALDAKSGDYQEERKELRDIRADMKRSHEIRENLSHAKRVLAFHESHRQGVIRVC